MLQLQSTIDGVSTKKDGSMGVRITTQELNSETKIQLMDMVGKFGWVLFTESETPLTEKDIPAYDSKAFDQIKSPATRMRGVIYRIWEQSTENTRGDFETFYRQKMEIMIEKLKEKLN